MKKAILLCALAIVCGTLSAQDLIVKQDASTIECKILRVGGSKVQFTKTGANTSQAYTLPTSEVLLIRYGDGREESFPQAAPQTKRSKIRSKDTYPHYQGDIAAAYGMGVGSITDVLNTDRIAFETVHGVRISPYAFIGLGAGFDYFYDLAADAAGQSSNGGAVTAFANAKGYYPISGGASVYLSLDLGGTFGVMNLMKDRNDMYASVGPGVSLGRAGSRQRFDIGVRYQYMGENTGAVLFRVGFEF